MKFDDKVKMMLNEAEVPDCLLPDNISIMLRNKMAEKNKKPVSSAISMKSNKRAMAFRYTAAIAACIALVFGVTAFINNDSDKLPIGYIKNDGEVKEAENYSDVYKALFDNFVKNGTAYEGIEKNTSGEKVINNTTGTETIINNSKDNDGTVTQYSFPSQTADGVEKADIVKTDGNNLYYVANSSLNVVSINNGKMKLLSKMNTGDNIPVELYLLGNKLVVVSNNTVEVPYQIKPQAGTAKSDETVVTSVAKNQPDSSSKNVDETTTPSETSVTSSETSVAIETFSDITVPSTILQNNTVVMVYDISDKAAPKLISDFRQNGEYISSGMINGSIYLVTNHSNYQTKPLESQDDLDNYVPSYYINNKKAFIDPKDIFIPSKVMSTKYTIVSLLDMNNEPVMSSIKAVLGDSSSVYCSGTGLYVFGSTNAIKNKDATSIIKFKFDNGKVSYSSNATVEGKIINEFSVIESDNSFKVVTNVTAAKNKYADVFIFDTNLTPLGSISNVSDGKAVNAVRFEGKYAYLSAENAEKAIVINLSDNAAPKKEDKNVSDFSVYLNKYSENKYVGLGAEYDEKGTQTGIKLSMYENSDGGFKELSSISLGGKFSDKLLGSVVDSRGLFIDSQNGIFGIPTVSDEEYGIKNMYYVVTYDKDAGFTQKGALEYKDIKNSNFQFVRGITVNDVFYALSEGRIVSAQSSDFKVIDALNI